MKKRTCNGCRAWIRDNYGQSSEPRCRLGYPVEKKSILIQDFGRAFYKWEMKPKIECPKPKSFTMMFNECDEYKQSEDID